MNKNRDYEAEAIDLLRSHMMRDADPGVRLIAATFDPPAAHVARVAAAIRANHGGQHD